MSIWSAIGGLLPDPIVALMQVLDIGDLMLKCPLKGVGDSSCGSAVSGAFAA